MGKLGTIAATFAAALGLGFFVQTGNATSPAEVSENERPPAPPVQSIMAVTNATGASVFGLPDVAGSPLPRIDAVQTVAAVGAEYSEPEVPQMGTIFATPFGDCQSTLEARPQVAATVRLIVNAPCNVDAFFVVRHQGMVFSGKTDAVGGAVIDVPALATRSVFSVSFDNVEVGSVAADVADVAMYDRAVLQWQGQQNLQLHALEFGATFGDPGHIWSASANRVDLAPSGVRGFIVRLGNASADISYQAEVYTFPSGMLNRDGEIAIKVGAVVTAENCGRSLQAESIQTNTGKMLMARRLSIPLPGCDRIGESVMLSDMFQNVTLALH